MTIPVFEDLSIARRTILRRVPFDEIDVPVSLLNAIEERFGARLTPAEAVDRILRDVRERGDDALCDWAQRLDNYAGPLEIAPEHCAAALDALDLALREAINLAIARLTRFHQRQVRTSWIEFDRACCRSCRGSFTGVRHWRRAGDWSNGVWHGKRAACR
jgi:histidinol dehydrogenase